MLARPLVLLLCSFTLLAQKVFVPLDESDKEGVVEILFVTSRGDSISEGVDVTVEKLVDGKPVASWEGGQTMKLKYGVYRLRAHYSGAYSVDKIVKIQNPFQAVSICFFIAPIESPWDGNLIRGYISEKSKQNDCRWVRFLSPFADGEFAETKASENGYFALDNVRPGKYLAFTIGKSGICEVAGVIIPFELGKAVYDLSIPWSEPRWAEATSPRR